MQVDREYEPYHKPKIRDVLECYIRELVRYSYISQAHRDVRRVTSDRTDIDHPISEFNERAASCYRQNWHQSEEWAWTYRFMGMSRSAT